MTIRMVFGIGFDFQASIEHNKMKDENMIEHVLGPILTSNKSNKTK